MHVVAETDIVLRDGSTVHVRPSTAEDVPRLRAFLAALSERARWFRFFSAGVNLDAAAASAAAPRDGLALIALREDAVVAHATFIRETPSRRRSPSRSPTPGTATGSPRCCSPIWRMRRRPKASARSPRPCCRRTAACSGCSTTPAFRSPRSRSEGEIELELPTSLSPEARRRFETRQRDAGVAAVAHVLRPASVAVIGASDRRGPRSCATCAPGASRERCTSSRRRRARRRRRRRRARGNRRARGGGRRRRPGLRRQGSARPRRADGGLRGGRRAARRLPGRRHAHGGP